MIFHVVEIPKRVLPSLAGSRAEPYISWTKRARLALRYIAERRSIRKKPLISHDLKVVPASP
jgi:hypothetical protein